MGKFLRCPLFASLMVLVFLASIVGFLVGGWLIVHSQFFYSSSMAATAAKKHAGINMTRNNTLEDIDLIHLSLMIIGILVIIVSFVLLWIALEILLLIIGSYCKANWIRSYQRQIEDDWSTAAKSQRGITY